MRARGFLVSVLLALFTGACSSLSEPLRRLEPMDEKLAQVRDRLTRLETVEAQLVSVNKNLEILDRRLSGLASIDSGIARTSASVTGLHAMIPGLEKVQAGLARVAGNEELVRVDGRLAQQLVALEDVKSLLREISAKLGGVSGLERQLEETNRQLGAVSTLATRAEGEAKEVLRWKTGILAVVGLALGLVGLNVLMHLRLHSLIARKAPPGMWRGGPSDQE